MILIPLGKTFQSLSKMVYYIGVHSIERKLCLIVLPHIPQIRKAAFLC